MELTIGNILLITFYFAIVFGIGFWVKRRETAKEYLIADKKVGLFQTTASIVAVMGGMVLVAQATLGFEMGIAAAWYFAGSALGMIFIGLFVEKVKAIADKNNFLTLADYFFTKFDHKNRILAATILFIALFALLVGQFIAAGSLFSPLLGINYATAILIMMFGTLVYLVLGGFKAVIKTDLFQFLIMAVVFGSILFIIDLGTYAPKQIDIISVGGPSIIIFLILGIFTVVSGADIWQRIFAAKNIKTAKRASYFSALFFFIFGTVLTIIGIAAKTNFPDIKPEEALYHGMFQLVPAPLVGLSIIFILAAIMSTIDTELFYLSLSLSKDFSQKGADFTASKLAINVRKFIIVLAIISALTAIFFSNIITIIFGMVSLSLAFSPTLAATFFWKIKSNAAFFSMAGGLLSLIILIISGNFSPDNSIITLPVAIVLLLIGQVLFRK